MLRCYFGHHKCGSTWIEAICGDVCVETGHRLEIVFRQQDLGGERLADHLRRTGTEFLAYANASYDEVAALPAFKGFHVVRDPRDVVVSAYFSHLHSHPTRDWPELVDYRKRLQSCDLHEGLLLEIDFRAEQFAEMMSWPDEAPNVLQLRYEDLIASEYKSFVTVFRHLELLDERHLDLKARATNMFHRFVARVGGRSLGRRGVPVERLLGIVWEHDFEKKSGGRKVGEEDVRSHFRKGQAGDWINYFQPEHRRRFHERYGPLLRKYGYERDDRWVDG
jgi:hypothetical protein